MKSRKENPFLWSGFKSKNTMRYVIHMRVIVLISAITVSGCTGIGSEKENRLARANSPYLREHADNPVDWYEWGPEALQKAKDEGKPLIISIGYASCHWCHVMEEESFMDTTVARLMNAHFVAIKIDREERPDIDQIYIDAAQLISGQAGWPLNAFALPDGKPFYAGTYFPKDQWIALLHQVKEAFTTENSAVVKQAHALTVGVEEYEQVTPLSDSPKQIQRESYEKLFSHWPPQFDYDFGGFKGAPKFPLPSNWEFLLQYHFLTGDRNALQMVTTTLDQLAVGGIYDQIGGGFSRYATDTDWKIPHFEKMLYDNAQLVSLYAHGYKVTGNPLYSKVISETLEFVRRELTDPEGGFYASINADSEGEEGKFYIWRKAEINGILDGKTSAVISDYYHILDSGNWEDKKNILYTNGVSSREFALRHGLTKKEWEKMKDEAKTKLLIARGKRRRPSTDDKVLTSWNALMLQACLDAYTATTHAEYLDTALKNARFLENTMIRPGGALWHSYRDGKAGINAFLDDYAFLARAFIKLYQVTFDVHWLHTARSLAEYALVHFQDNETGLFYYTPDDSDALVVRKMDITDDVLPSANSVMAEVLLLLAEYYQEASYAETSNKMLLQITETHLLPSSTYYANWAILAGLSIYKPFEVALVGPKAVEKNLEIQRQYNPLALYLGGINEDLPLLENKYVTGKTIIYVCRNRVCAMPVQNVSEALEQLNGYRISFSDSIRSAGQ